MALSKFNGGKNLGRGSEKPSAEKNRVTVDLHLPHYYFQSVNRRYYMPNSSSVNLYINTIIFHKHDRIGEHDNSNPSSLIQFVDQAQSQEG